MSLCVLVGPLSPGVGTLCPESFSGSLAGFLAGSGASVILSLMQLLV